MKNVRNRIENVVDSDLRDEILKTVIRYSLGRFSEIVRVLFRQISLCVSVVIQTERNRKKNKNTKTIENKSMVFCGAIELAVHWIVRRFSIRNRSIAYNHSENFHSYPRLLFALYIYIYDCDRVHTQTNVDTVNVVYSIDRYVPRIDVIKDFSPRKCCIAILVIPRSSLQYTL